MSNSIQILSKDIRQNNGLYSLNDLHKASGSHNKHRPSLFIRLDQTKDLLQEINLSTDMCLGINSKALRVVKGGINAGTYACKQIVIAYGAWISPKLHLAVINAFLEKHGVTNEPQSPYIQDEQLNYIKKGVAKIVHSTGKSWQAVYNELFNHVQAPRLREIRKERYDDACVFLGVKIINHQIRTKNISISYIDKQNIQKMCQNIDTIYQYWDNLYLGLVNLNSNLIPYLGGPFNDAHFYSQEIRKCFNFD